MSEYTEALQALSIEEDLLKVELKELINLLPQIKICKLCLLSRIIIRQNTHIDIHALRLEFPELRNAFICSACSLTIRTRCHKYIDAQNAYVAIVKQLFDEATIELQIVREKIRLLADRKEIHENEYSAT